MKPQPNHLIINIVKAMHASLNQRYDLKSGGFVRVGDCEGTYAPEDSATGAEYRCLGEGSRGKKVSHSSEFRPGLFYPENVFIYGYDENDDSLPHETLETIKNIFWGAETKRVILPRGYEKGVNTWDNALMYSPIDGKPQWHQIDKRVSLFPGAELIEFRGSWLCFEIPRKSIRK